MTPRICLGFDASQGSCTNPAGPDSPYWCKGCNGLWLAHVERLASVPALVSGRGAA